MVKKRRKLSGLMFLIGCSIIISIVIILLFIYIFVYVFTWNSSMYSPGFSEYANNPNYSSYVQVKVYEYNSQGQKVSFLFDAWKSISRSIMSVGKTDYFYNTAGNLSKETHYNFKNETEYYSNYVYYDSGALKKVETFYIISKNKEGATHYKNYDERGNILSEFDGGATPVQNNSWKYTYDSQGRVTGVIYNSYWGNSKYFTITKNEYGYDGELIKVSSCNFNTEDKDTNCDDSDKWESETYQYNNKTNKKILQLFYYGETLANFHNYNYYYDDNGNLMAEREFGFNNQTEEYTEYDLACGKPTSIARWDLEDHKLQDEEYKYDSRCNIVTETTKDYRGDLNFTFTTEYDNLYSYDTSGKITKEILLTKGSKQP